MIVNLFFQPIDQRFDLTLESRYTFAADDFGVDDAGNPLDGAVEVVIHHDVLVFID